MHIRKTRKSDVSTIGGGKAARRRSRLRRSCAAVGASLVAVGALSGPALAAPQQHAAHASVATSYQFTTLNDQADPTFNQLLGINNHRVIAGYFGSGQPGHPNKGYVLTPPYGQQNYENENFPGSEQTQVTGLNNKGVTVGFWADAAGDNFGFSDVHGVFKPYSDPNTGTGTVNQLLGVNDHGTAAGFYTDGNGVTHGYTLNLAHNKFTEVTVPGDTNVTAAGINDHGTVAGFATTAGNTTESFVHRHGHRLLRLNAPGAASTQALGISNNGEVVGDYVDGAGNMHGFTWTVHGGFRTVDDPNGVGGTTINGVNDHGDLVGFYVDPAGNTDGLLATPIR